MGQFIKTVLFSLIAASVNVVLAQDNVISPTDNLVVEGIPKIPLPLAEEINRYTEFRYGALSNWHPTKREMLISTRFANTSQIHLLKYPGAARTQLTFFRDGTGGVWSNSGDRYAYESTRRNGEDVDIWMLNPANAKSDRMLAQLKGGGWGV